MFLSFNCIVKNRGVCKFTFCKISKPVPVGLFEIYKSLFLGRYFLYLGGEGDMYGEMVRA